MHQVQDARPLVEDAPITVLICATMWWPLSARLAMAFSRHGCRVSAVCPAKHPLRFVSGVERIFPYGSFDSLASLAAAIEATEPDLIIPCDDGVVLQLHTLHDRRPGLRELIDVSLGSSYSYGALRSRGALLQIATDLGIRVPTTKAIRSEDEFEKLPPNSAAVLKLDCTWGGNGVVMATTRQELTQTFRSMSRRKGVGFAIKRCLVNCDPLALWFWRRRAKPSVTMQAYVAGRPANCMIACWQGEVLGIVSVEVLATQGPTGAATVVRIIQNNAMEDAARLLAKRLGLSGFHGLDFMLEAGSGDAYLIEMNPRCTQLGHLRLPVQGDLAGCLLTALSGRHEDGPTDVVEQDVVAFFPQTSHWNPESIYLKSGYHDVPWEEPALVRELERTSWPERQWISRIYHFFRSSKQTEEVQY